MALQGTIDTFALPDVLRLLASTRKTGCLRLEGSRGTGAVWVDIGAIVAGEASGAPEGGSMVDVLFEMLRYPDGGFQFEAGVEHDSPSEPRPVEPLLAEAEEALDDWRAIEAVVPSLAAWVTLAPELPDDEVTIDRASWKLVTAIGGGSRVAEIGDALGMTEIPVSRVVKELVELGLAVVDDRAPQPAPARFETVVHDEIEEPGRFEPVTVESEAEPVLPTMPSWEGVSAGSDFEPLTVDTPATAPEPARLEETPIPMEPVAAAPIVPDPFAPVAASAPVWRPIAATAPVSIPSTAPSAPAPAGASAGADDDGWPATDGAEHTPWTPSRDWDSDDDWPAGSAQPAPVDDVRPEEEDELARQLASLSPKAARAVAMAAQATTSRERDAALEEASRENDEPLNRGLLLRFLSGKN